MKNLKTISLDPVGEFYASIIGEAQPGVYSISAYLKKAVDPSVLQLAVNDIMQRLPFLCGRLTKDDMGYHHEFITEPPKISVDDDIFTTYYLEGLGHVLRVRYGQSHIKVEAIHSIIDGTGLVKFISGLIVRYSELLGLTFDKGGIVSCFDSLTPEEMENAYAKFSNSVESTEEEHDIVSAYHHEGSKRAPMQIIRHTFDLSKIKAVAKPYTVTEYIMAHIFMEIARERQQQGIDAPITSLLPINCRRFFSCETYRNFVANSTIVMPETDDLDEMLKQIHLQFKSLDKHYVQGAINSLQSIQKYTQNMSHAEKQQAWQQFSDYEYESNTTTFSNLGLVKLPTEIEEQIENLEFVVSLPESMPTSFSSITMGNKLTLAISLSLENDELAQNLIESIKKIG